jgi:hypothetical protein
MRARKLIRQLVVVKQHVEGDECERSLFRVAGMRGRRENLMPRVRLGDGEDVINRGRAIVTRLLS